MDSYRSCAIALSLLTALLAGCTPLFFQPQRELVDTPQRHGIEYRTVDLHAADGTRLSSWFLPARTGGGAKAQATILFLHGNAENISTHFRSVAWLPAEGFNVLALDYRGYGDSEGVASVAGALLDIDAAMRYLVEDRSIDPDRIIVYGQSLGGALAIAYVAHSRYRSHIRAVVIDSAFTDYRAIVREKLAETWLTWPFQWVAWLTVDDTYSPAASVASISPLPLLLIHGDRDEVVPLHDSRQLFELAHDPKELWIVPSAGHTQALANEGIRKRLVAYLVRYTSAR